MIEFFRKADCQTKIHTGRSLNMELINPLPPIDEQTIQKFETEYNISLPTPYRQFLLQSNGGSPNLQVFKFVHGEWGETKGIIGFFLGIGEDDNVGLNEWINEYTGRIPKDLIPIAFDVGGNLICIGIGGGREGQIYFWDHGFELVVEDDQEPTYDNVYFVADSFEDFISSLSLYEF